MTPRFGFLTLACLLSVSPLQAQPVTEEQPLTQTEAERLFALDVLPVLRAKCFACHANEPTKLKGEFDMRTRDGLLKGGESEEPSLVPGKPETSPLYQAIRWQNGLEMPPKENDRLSEKQVETVRKWITAGAPWPDAQTQKKYREELWNTPRNKDGVLVKTSGGLSDDWTYRRYKPADLWAYQPLTKVVVPANPLTKSKHPIDAFLNQQMKSKSITPVPQADKLTLIRRATYDLTGLPPTPEEIAAFLKDDSKDAWATLIERLLDSPHYGERMAQHWLDVVRYADTAGFSNDFDRPNAWRYRDYVIRSFNDDKPYDQFLTEQLAGDELDDTKPENLIAVGFLRMGPWEHTAMSVAAVTRQQYLDDVTQSVGETFLATSMRCFKCHDHKFDPLPTRDYYRMQAVFAPVQFADRLVQYLPEENRSRFETESARLERFIKDDGLKLILPPDATEQERKEDQLGLNKVRRKRKAILERERIRYQPRALSVYNGPLANYVSNKALHTIPKKLSGKVQDVSILSGGVLESPMQKVTPGVLSPVSFSKSTSKIPGNREGRRLALAKWITDRDNPLTARVMINRIWQWHFGRGIAANANNFGVTGAKPTHPQLLDWLALQFLDSGWSVKDMHRLIMTSDAYQRGGHPLIDAPVYKLDPENHLLSFFPPRRLSAEEIRDSMLLISGELNREQGGLPVRPEINLEVAMQPRHIMGSVGPAYQPSRTPAERNRRTIYALRIRTLRNPMLEVFDKPDPDVSCEKRNSSTVTPQVFSLFNAETTQRRSVALAHRIAQITTDPVQQVQHAFRLTYGRPPTDAEQELALAHLRKMTEYHRTHPAKKITYPTKIKREMIEEMTGLTFEWEEKLDIYANYEPDLNLWDVNEKTRGLSELCLVLLNSNQFLYVY